MLDNENNMGYKSVLRSLGAASRRAAREAERARKQSARARERFDKKAAAIYAKRDSVVDALEKEYALGKITAEEFQKLRGREGEIGLELIVLGKAAGIALGKRYLCGKIEKEEFERIRREIVPRGFFEESDQVLAGYNRQEKMVEEFRVRCSLQQSDICQQCGLAKNFFRRLSLVDNLLLCRTCKKELESIKHYPGFSGSYVFASPKQVGGDAISAIIKPEYFL